MNENLSLHKILGPLSGLYQIVTDTRNKCFDRGILKSKRFDIPVISIGNLAACGTGKTPHTEYLIRLLNQHMKVAVLSRGYKRKTKGFVLASDKSETTQIGDEPYQMHRKFPNTTIAVDESRCEGIEQLLTIKSPPIEVVLLDDAFQHRYVKPGLSILLTDYHRLFSSDRILPVGMLRESKQGKSRAQIVIVTKCPHNIKPIECNIIKQNLKLFPYQHLFFSTFQYKNLRAVFPEATSKKELQLTTLTSEDEILLVTGIASPAPMIEELRKYTSHIKLLRFPDHHQFTKKDVEEIEKQYQQLKNKNTSLIITTEKDAVRLKNLPSLNQTLKSNIYELPIEVAFLQEKQQEFNILITDYVRKNQRNSSIPPSEDAHKP